jgi:SAM-dependent methyltransferase
MSEEPLPWDDDFFDAVFCYEVFEHLTNPHRLFFEARRVLKRDYFFYFSVPCQEIDLGYGLGLHPFVYPGLLIREHLERFIMQMYFRIDGYHESGFHLEGRSYKLCNKKDPSKDDIVYVVPRSNNVRELYAEVISPEKLAAEIDREVYRLIGVAMHHALAGDVVQIRDSPALRK